MLLGKFSNPEVKPRIVNQNNGIRSILQYVLFAVFDIVQDRPQIHKDFGKAHKGKLPVMFYQSSANLFHEVASPKPEISVGLLIFQRLHQIGGMKVA